MRTSLWRFATVPARTPTAGRMALTSGVRIASSNSTILRTVGGNDIGSAIKRDQERDSVLAALTAQSRTPESFNVAVAGEQTSTATLSGTIESFRIVTGHTDSTTTISASSQSLPPATVVNLPRALRDSACVLQVMLKVVNTFTPVTETRLADGTTITKPTSSSIVDAGLVTVLCPFSTGLRETASAVGCSETTGEPLPPAEARAPFMKVGGRVLVSGRFRTVLADPSATGADCSTEGETVVPFCFLQLQLDGALTGIKPLP
eukprot:GILI01039120.1.p1 GENE.GILI01039120.1~~GILI01039120.1.p1  ORF type:complete len:272 (-),score=32.76 GILI01039120.1:25-810(-)